MNKKKDNQQLIKTSNGVKAYLKYLRISPRKARLVTNLVKGLTTEQAVKNLAFTPKRTALPILKLLKSAINNAKILGLDSGPTNLYIKEIKVDEGPVLKRHMPRARGRATVIRKRTSHITLVLSEREKSQISNPKSQTKFKKPKSKKIRN